MYIYFKIDPTDNSIMAVIKKSHEFAGYVTRNNNPNNKPFIVPVTVTDPNYNVSTQNKSGITDTYTPSNNTATRVRTVSDKSDDELEQIRVLHERWLATQ